MDKSSRSLFVSNPIKRLPIFFELTPTSPLRINGSNTQFNLKLLASKILVNNLSGFLENGLLTAGISNQKFVCSLLLRSSIRSPRSDFKLAA